jgi:acyl-CoA synthetase (NDP forming)
MGVLNTDPAVQLNGTFAPQYPPRGNVAMSSQSGALGIAILDYATELNIGISTFVSVGNKTDISGNDLLLYWEDDPSTDVILLYLESFGNPRRFARIARRIAKKKPILAVKSGRTSAGTRAASSHTGALASLDVAVEALFHQTGVIRTDTLEELFDVTALLANQPVPKGRRVGVITNAGGPGILIADALESNGMQMPVFSDELQKRLRAHLSDEASVRNPVDMIASAGPDQYRACLKELLDTDEIDTAVAIYIPAAPEGTEEVAAAIRDAGVANAGKKTFLSVFMRAEGAPPEIASEEHRVPTYPFPEAAARALARAATYGEWLNLPEGEIPEFQDVRPEQARDAVASFLDRRGPEGGWLEPDQVASVLEAFGLALPRSRTCLSADDAAAFAAEVGGPVVLKVVSDTALHKSDIGGVVLGVEGDEDVRAAYQKVTSVVDDAAGALVQEFVPGGHEVIIGMTEDPSFGPLILFGLGGIFVELIGDAAFRIHPLTTADAADMIKQVKSARLLEGYRGGEPGDVAAVKEALLRVSALIEEVPEIVEMDLNPVKVLAPGRGVRAVDARIRVRRTPGAFIPSREDIPAAERVRR